MFNSLRSFTIGYSLLVLVFMSTVIFDGLQLVHYLVKPLFMVMLMVYVTKHKGSASPQFSNLILFGLFFSWLGDIALMFDEKVEILFVVGLAAFLIAHLGYGLAFIRNIKDSEADFNVSKAILLGIPFALFTGVFFYFIQADIPSELYVPVLAYTIVISIMGILSALRIGHVDSKSNQWILIGAILFILSDCVIAVNKFVVDFDYDAVLNMFLYLGGQYMIAIGAVYYSNALNSQKQDS